MARQENPVILYHDNHLVVALKPAGISIQPEDPRVVSFPDRIKKWLKETYHKPGNVFLGIVHRLDRPVGGVMVFARTSKGAARLSEQIRAGRFGKWYSALVEGQVSVAAGQVADSAAERTVFKELVHTLKKVDRRSNIVEESDPEGKTARLLYTVQKQFTQRTLLEIRLLTGRYHQIRAQLSAVGHPIIGDTKYGGQRVKERDEIALFCRRIEFFHPILGEKLVFEAECPEKWMLWGRQG